MTEENISTLEPKPKSTVEKFVPLLVLITIGLAFLVGILWQKAKVLESGTVKNASTDANTAVNQQTPDPLGKLSSDQVKKIPPVTSTDHFKGSKESKVTLIEYFDLQCPYCKQFHPVVEQALNEYKGQLAWVVRDYPLYSIHSKAEPAAEAAECVAAIGGADSYWNFIDKVMAGQPESLDRLPAIVSQVGVSSTKVVSCAQAKTYKGAIDSDYNGGVTAGVTGTPGNFIINQKGEAWLIPGFVPYEQLKLVIDEALKG
ncbi:thioredoxin domain-containing protein [Candidatus Woesebacteria bacterium]|nr:thioredoxin domain-containing protein [Candidatus Woesebacteria bacterium]